MGQWIRALGLQAQAQDLSEKPQNLCKKPSLTAIVFNSSIGYGPTETNGSQVPTGESAWLKQGKYGLLRDIVLKAEGRE